MKKLFSGSQENKIKILRKRIPISPIKVTEAAATGFGQITFQQLYNYVFCLCTNPWSYLVKRSHWLLTKELLDES